MKKGWNFLSGKKKIILLIIILLFIFLIGKFYLYISFLLGNDITVKLETDQEFITLAHGEEGNLKFNAKVTTNPFCKAGCSSKFIDIGKNEVVDKSDFNLKPGFGINKNYNVRAPDKGLGIKLYRFDMECKSVNTVLCHTKEEPTTRSVLVNVNYTLTDFEERIKNNAKEKIKELTNELNSLNKNVIILENGVDELNKTVIVDELENELLDLKKNITDYYNYLDKQAILFYKEDYEKIKIEDFDINDYKKIDNETNELILLYNNLINELTNLKNNLNELNGNVSNEELNESIKIFNDNLDLFKQKDMINKKENLVKEIKDRIKILEENKIAVNTTLEENINSVDINFIKLDENISAKPFEIDLIEPKPICCVLGNCTECCLDEKCNNDPSKFPVIFVHGHAISKSVSIEYSLEGFNNIQKKLEEDGYLSVGTITPYTKIDTPNGIWGQINVPVTIRLSYYFDIFKEPENYVIVQKKSENIDTYALRLRELINMVKLKTGKPKVNIIAFSMGGLVARRYIQIFEGNDVDKLILLGSPNKGITGTVATLCPITGEELECRDMNENSLFINKLSNDAFPKIEMYNIFGTGCEMDKGMGDGIVLENNARLENANNYAVDGECEGVSKILHLDLLKNQEVYDIIKGILNESK